MRLRWLAVFGAGYVLGSRAGRERYAQIKAAARRAAQPLEEYGAEGSLARAVHHVERDPGSHSAA